MGPYYRGTSQGMGAFFDAFYQHPILMLLLVTGIAGVVSWVWYKNKSGKQSDL